MKLLTKELEKQLKPLYACENQEDPIAVTKFFCPWNQWTWFAWEAAQRDMDGNQYPLTEQIPCRADVIFFGAVKGHEFELGCFSLNELQAIRGPGGLGIERDLCFTPTPLSKIRAEYDR